MGNTYKICKTHVNWIPLVRQSTVRTINLLRIWNTSDKDVVINHFLFSVLLTFLTAYTLDFIWLYRSKALFILYHLYQTKVGLKCSQSVSSLSSYFCRRLLILSIICIAFSHISTWLLLACFASFHRLFDLNDFMKLDPLTV